MTETFDIQRLKSNTNPKIVRSDFHAFVVFQETNTGRFVILNFGDWNLLVIWDLLFKVSKSAYIESFILCTNQILFLV